MPKAKAGEIATELRRVADALDKEPETALPQPLLSFYCNDHGAADKGKAVFLATVRLLPRPLTKAPSDTVYQVEHGRNDSEAAIWLRAQIDRSSVCTVIEPAKPAVYDCPALLSEEEEAELARTAE
jgi:hypothetical protein